MFLRHVSKPSCNWLHLMPTLVLVFILAFVRFCFCLRNSCACAYAYVHRDVARRICPRHKFYCLLLFVFTWHKLLYLHRYLCQVLFSLDGKSWACIYACVHSWRFHLMQTLVLALIAFCFRLCLRLCLRLFLFAWRKPLLYTTLLMRQFLCFHLTNSCACTSMLVFVCFTWPA